MRKKVWLCAAFVLLLGACNVQPAAPCVTVDEQTVFCGSDTLVEDIRMPVVSGFSDDAFEEEINARIAAFVRDARDDAKEQAEVVQQWVAYVCVLSVDYDVKNSCGLFSMRLTADLENGGTGLPQTIYINADIENNRELALDDLFESTGYRAAISEHIAKEISGDERFFPGAFTGISEHTAFFISEGKLFIAFGKYEIASGMTGEPVFEIPRKVFSRYLKPEYKAHFKA